MNQIEFIDGSNRLLTDSQVNQIAESMRNADFNNKKFIEFTERTNTGSWRISIPITSILVIQIKENE